MSPDGIQNLGLFFRHVCLEVLDCLIFIKGKYYSDGNLWSNESDKQIVFMPQEVAEEVLIDSIIIVLTGEKPEETQPCDSDPCYDEYEYRAVGYTACSRSCLGGKNFKE